MSFTVIYSSTQACPPVLNLAFRLRAKGHQSCMLGQLPKPLPARTASLRPELAGLQQDERTIRRVLSQYAAGGGRLPDVCHQGDLQDDLAVTRWRLGTVQATLQALGEGPAVRRTSPSRPWWRACLSGVGLLAAIST